MANDKRKGTRCKSDSSSLVQHLPLHSDSLLLLSMTESQHQNFPAPAAGREVTMGWGSLPLCSVPGGTCSDNQKIQLWGLFPEGISQPLLYHSGPFPANYRTPVMSRHARYRCKLPCRQWLLPLVTALPHTQLIYSRH